MGFAAAQPILQAQLPQRPLDGRLERRVWNEPDRCFELVACYAVRDVPEIIELGKLARQREEWRKHLDHPPLHLPDSDVTAVTADRFGNGINERASGYGMAWKAERLVGAEPLARLRKGNHRGGEVGHVGPFVHHIERARIGDLVAHKLL